MWTANIMSNFEVFDTHKPYYFGLKISNIYNMANMICPLLPISVPLFWTSDILNREYYMYSSR